MKIDIHTHILPQSLPRFKDKFGYGGLIELRNQDSCAADLFTDDGKFFRKVGSNLWNPSERIKECEKLGVSIQLLSTLPALFGYFAKDSHGYDLCRFLNDHLASVVQQYPKRFMGLGSLPLQSPKLAIKELERCKKDLALVGAQIGTHVNDWNLDEDCLFEVFEAAVSLDLAIFVHPWDMMGQDKMKKYWLPWLVGMPAELSLAICSLIFGGVLERLPHLRIAFAHGGGAFPGTFGRIEQGFKVRPDLCAVKNPISPRKYLGRFFVDSLTHDASVFSQIISLFGENRVCLGSDYPFPLGEETPGHLIESSPFSRKTKARLLAGNALEWLGKTEKDLIQ